MSSNSSADVSAMPLHVLAIGVGAAGGAWLRWALSLALNPRTPAFPLGTLAANLLGGYLVGLAVAWFGARTDIDAAWRLFAITGFLGGLTTFSTYSAEVVEALLRGAFAAGIAIALAHLAGSLVLTWLGILTYRALVA
jgi:CrcB protein